MTAILTLTMNSSVDVSMHVDRMMATGKTRSVVDSVRGGGGGINVARCIRKLGGTATALYTTSPDEGRRLDDLLAEEGLDRIPMHINDEIREAVVVAEAATGHSYHIVPQGPWLTPREIEHCLESISVAARHHPFLVITGSLPRGVPDDFCAEVIREVRPFGTKVVLDITGAQLTHALHEPAFVVRLDRHEAAYLIGRPIENFADARAANEYVLERGAAEIAVTTVGPLGTMCSTRERHTEITVPPLPGPARSDACAGDSLVAALTFRLAAGDDAVAACEWGVAAAAATVLRPGTETFDHNTVVTLHAAIAARQFVCD